jgi:hypothetical protein
LTFLTFLFLFKGIATFEDIPELQDIIKLIGGKGRGRISRDIYDRIQKLGHWGSNYADDDIRGANVIGWAQDLITELQEEKLAREGGREPRTLLQIRDPRSETEIIQQLYRSINQFGHGNVTRDQAHDLSRLGYRGDYTKRSAHRWLYDNTHGAGARWELPPEPELKPTAADLPLEPVEDDDV